MHSKRKIPSRLSPSWGWLILLFWLHTPGSALAQTTLKVYTWADIMDFRLIEAFEARTGQRVDYDTYRSREALEARLAAGSGDLDLLMLPGDLLIELVERGELRALDITALQNWQHLHPSLLEASAVIDPFPRHGIPYFWGATGLLMDATAIRRRLPTAQLDSLALLLDPGHSAALADCGIWLLDSASEVIPAVLTYLGEDRNTSEAQVLARVEQHLQAIWPSLAGVHSLHGLDHLVDGEACLAMSWSDGAARAREIVTGGHGPSLDFQVPREGTQLWLDFLVIPANAPHPREALQLLDYLLDPQVHARVANYAFQAPTNEASWPQLFPEIRHDPAVFPPMPPGGFYTVTPDPEVHRAWDELWARLSALRVTPGQ